MRNSRPTHQLSNSSMRSERPRIKGVTALATLLAAGSLLAPTYSPAQAQSGQTDYFVSAFGDPMDFSNQEDLVTNTNEAMFVGATNKSISDGQLHFDAAGNYSVDMVWPGFATGIPHGREGGRVPIDASQYRRVVIRMNVPAGSALGVRWYNCLDQAKCEGGQSVPATPGWNTYDIALGQGANSGSVPWSGNMLGLRLIGLTTGHVDVDWVRLVPADAQNVGEIVGGPTINLAPTDRLDYATATGNAWDMDSLRDVSLVGIKPGATAANNRLSACTIGTATNQFPGLVFNMNGGTIDANRFKTLTFEYSYEGAFSTKPTPGGGAFARVFWFDERGNRHPTNAIHLYPNENIVQIRLDSEASIFQEIEAGKGVATGEVWGGRVTQFRINPNDTKDSRCFTIGRVWLTADEPAGAAVTPSPVAAKPVTTPTTKKKAVASVRITTRKVTPKKTTTKKPSTKPVTTKKK